MAPGRPDLDVADLRTIVAARNTYSRELAASRTTDDVRDALSAVLGRLLPGDQGVLLRRQQQGWRGWLDTRTGPPAADAVEVAAPEALDAALATGACSPTTLVLQDRSVAALAVPAGPPSSRTVLALVPTDGVVLDDASHQLAVAIAAEAWAALRRLEVVQQLEEKVARLEALDRQRADHIAGITHDLRSPVTAVLGFARTLSQAGDLLSEEERQEALRTIERQSLRMSRMLEDMLDSARAEAGELTPDRREPVPLHTAVADALAVASSDHRPRLQPHVDPVEVCGDAGQLTRVVQNLISNALDYAPPASPVQVVVREDAGDGVLQVIDHGPGIPDGVDVFTRFGRGHRRGTGLGLYTVKRIVEQHEGSIALTGTPGGGTTVTVRLPLFLEPPEGGTAIRSSPPR